MNKTSIIQIESIYSRFKESVYKKYFELFKNLDYLSICTFFGTTEWSGGQNVVQFLNPSVWSSNYILANFEIAQVKWAIENGLKIDFGAVNYDEILSAQINKIQPQVIYLSDIGSFNFDILNVLNYKPLVVAWRATTISPDIPWNKIDLLLSGIEKLRLEAKNLGVKNTEKFMSAAPSYRRFCSDLNPADESFGGAVFSGGLGVGLHDLRTQLFEHANQQLGNIIDIYSETRLPYAKTPVFGIDVVSLYSKYRTVVDFRADFGHGELPYTRETSNMRIFEATRAGSLLLTERCTNLQEYFDLGVEVETFGSSEEFIDKLKFYSDDVNEGAARTIALNGYKRTIASHTIESRAIQFSNILKCYL